jgi:hypothetical protein
VRQELLDRLIAGWRKLAEAEKKAENRLWMLQFRFGNLRLMTIEVPGTGGKTVTVWYWRYDVVNPTDRSHQFVPGFEIVTPEKVYHDGVWAGLTEAVRRIEDPSRVLDLKNSVTIAAEPIPPAQGLVSPKGVAGVAVWGYGEPEAAKARSCTIFVSGLTNAWSVTNSPEGDTLRRKVLKVSFKRVGQEMVLAGPPEWVYRSYPVEKALSSAKPRAETEAEKRKIEIEKVRNTIAGLQQQLKSWQKEREQLEAVILQWKQVVERASPDRRVEKEKVARELQRQLEAGLAEDRNRQVELDLLDKKLRALERASARPVP